MADPIKTAKHIFDQFLAKADPQASVGQSDVSTVSVYMAQIGKRGGKIGGKRRMDRLTVRQRKALARKAAQARWSKNNSNKQE